MRVIFTAWPLGTGEPFSHARERSTRAALARRRFPHPVFRIGLITWPTAPMTAATFDSLELWVL